MHAINLLPSDQRSASVSGKAPRAAKRDVPVGALTILLVLVVAIVAVGLRVQQQNTVKDREAQVAAVRTEIAGLQTQAARLARYEAFRQLATTRQQTVAALATGRFDWSRALRDVSRVLPADTYLSNICADGGAGGCETGLRGALPNATAVVVSGCTTSQDAVAGLMSRLRDVRGVTRVTLASSITATRTGERSGGTGCPAGAPPAFELIAFFERAPVSAAGLANGTAAPVAATPTPTTTASPTPASTP